MTTGYLIEESGVRVNDEYICYESLEIARNYLRNNYFDDSYKIYMIVGEFVKNDIIPETTQIGTPLYGIVIRAIDIAIVEYK